MEIVPEKTIERLIVYRRILNKLIYEGEANIFSHKLAELANSTPAQVRRDFMVIGYSGSPAKGYQIADLELSISEFLDNPKGQNIAVIGIGKLGTAILKDVYWNYSNLSKLFAFDIDRKKIGKVIEGIEILSVDKLKETVEKENIKIAVLCVPEEVAQITSDYLISYGVRGIVNYTPVHLIVPDFVIVENIDTLLTLEKVSYFLRHK